LARVNAFRQKYRGEKAPGPKYIKGGTDEGIEKQEELLKEVRHLPPKASAKKPLSERKTLTFVARGKGSRGSTTVSPSVDGAITTLPDCKQKLEMKPTLQL